MAPAARAKLARVFMYSFMTMLDLYAMGRRTGQPRVQDNVGGGDILRAASRTSIA
jgi:hypothetical protein